MHYKGVFRLLILELFQGYLGYFGVCRTRMRYAFITTYSTYGKCSISYKFTTSCVFCGLPKGQFYCGGKFCHRIACNLLFRRKTNKKQYFIAVFVVNIALA